ncbi:MAG: mechanosensitive ion channel domain-containing protein [Chthoniobacteraceae bacterium]
MRNHFFSRHRRHTLRDLSCLAAALAFVVACPGQTPSILTKETKPEAPPAPEALIPPAPESVPLTEIVTEAETVSDLLTRTEDSLKKDPRVAEIEAKLPESSRAIDHALAEVTDLLEASPALEVLRDLELGLRTRHETLRNDRILTEHAKRLEAELDQLNQLKETWTRTSVAAREAQAPDALIKSVADTIQAIEAMQKRVTTHRDHVLTMQTAVARETARIDGGLEAIRRAREERLNHLLVRDAEPIWAVALGADSIEELFAALKSRLSEPWPMLRQFVIDSKKSVPIVLLFFGAMILALISMRRRARPWIEKEPSLEPAFRVLDSPVAISLILTFLLLPAIVGPAPLPVRALLGAVVLLPVVHVLHGLIERPLVPALYALLVFYFMDRLRDLAITLPLASRLLFLVEMSLAIALIIWLKRSHRTSGPGIFRRVRRGLRLALPLLIIAVLADVAGYVSLAHLLGNGVMTSAYFAVVLNAALRISISLVAFALRVRPLTSLRMIQRNRPLVQRRIETFLLWTAYIVWAVLTLELLELRQVLWDYFKSVLVAKWTIGSVAVSLGGILAFVLTIWAAFLISRFVRFVLEEDVYHRVRLPRGVPYAVSTLLNYAVLLGGFLLALAATGANMDRFAVLAGAFGVGLGFGLNTVVNNFVSGLILLFERPLQVGDSVQLGDTKGEIRRIGIRASILRTFDGAEVIVPNGSLLSEKVINWTLSDHERRIDIDVGVAYGTYLKQALALLITVGKQHKLVIETPPPTALFLTFGDSSLNLQLRVWTIHTERWMAIRSDLSVAIDEALKAAGIEIPFPQRDLHLRSVAEEVRGLSGPGKLSDPGTAISPSSDSPEKSQ